MPVSTVLGPVPANELGPTTMHEHVLLDAARLQRASPGVQDQRPFTVADLGDARWNILAHRDNLRLDDIEAATHELESLTELGCRTLVELTVVGLGPDPDGLERIARTTGLRIVTGVGIYVQRTHPTWVASAGARDLVTWFDQHLSGTDGHAPAGIVGVIGTSGTISQDEQRVLRAAATAATMHGVAINVRTDPTERTAHRVLDIVDAEGLPPERVILGTMDEALDGSYHRELAARGATLEFCFGSENYYADGSRDPTDAARIEALAALLADRLAEHIVVGCAAWTKSGTRRFGGPGYEHLWRRVLPTLQETFAIDPVTLDTMTVVNPQRLLARP